MTISEVSAITGLSQDTLRYYERIKLLPTIERKKGIRRYSESDLRWIDFVKCMRSVDFPLEALIEYFELFKQGDSTIEARKELLREQRSALIKKRDEINSTIERLDYKIQNYETTLMKKEKEMAELD